MSLNPIIALDHVIEEYRDHLQSEVRARDRALRGALEGELDRPLFLAQEPFYQAHRPFRAGLAVSDSGLPVVLPPASVPSLPTTGASFTGNTVNAVQVSGDAAVSESGTWPDPGVPYWLVDDVAVDGKADAPAIVTLSAGVDLLLDNNVGLYVGRNGAAGFVVDGTAAAPVTMEPWSANTPGAWGGLGLYENTVAGGSRLSHLTIGYAGGTTLKGNLHLVDASPVLDTGTSTTARSGVSTSTATARRTSPT